MSAIRQPERARGRSLRARVVRLFWLDIGLVGRVPVQEGVRDVEELQVWGGDRRARQREKPDHHLLVTSIVPTPSPAGGCARSSTTDTITACLVRWASMGSRLLSVSSAHKPTVTSNSRFSARLRELPPGRRSARARNAERKNPRVSGHGSSGERPTPESAQPSIAARRRAPESLENPCVMSQKSSTILRNVPPLGHDRYNLHTRTS